MLRQPSLYSLQADVGRTLILSKGGILRVFHVCHLFALAQDLEGLSAKHSMAHTEVISRRQV